MENSYITKRQYGLIIFFIPFVFKFSVLPSILSEKAARDIWLVMLLIMLTELAQLIFIVKVDKMGGLDAIKERYGKITYYLLSAPVLAVMILKASVYTSETTSYANSYLFYNITTQGVGIIVILASSYIAVKGAKGLGRIVELALWLVPIAIIIGALFGKLKLTPDYALPIGANGLGPIAISFDSALFWVLDFSPLLFLKIREDVTLSPRKRTRFPWVPVAAISSAILMVGLYLAYVMNYGGAGHLVDTAFSSLGAFNVVNTEIGSIDWPAITLWLSIAIVSLSLKLFASSKVISSNNVPFPVAVLLTALVIIVISQLAFYNLEKAFDFATSFVRYVVLGIELLVPMTAYVLLDIKERKHQKEHHPLEATI
ncbi:MAG: GerAB/ArcD/ProY family transporter [Clostridia bacterium]|nr:GerAB/ArcD/ProY family transporter [Clostridia bacterium]